MNTQKKNGTTSLHPNKDLFGYSFRTCQKEILEPLKGTKSGQIPTWINGTLVRNGPGRYKIGEMEYNHMFDGSALLRSFTIRNGEVSYQCRFLQSETYKKNLEAKKIMVSEFGTDAAPEPCRSIFSRLSVLFNMGTGMSDNATISVYPYGDELYALSENTRIHRINPDNLETTKSLNLSQHVSLVTHSAHPHIDENGDVYNTGISITLRGPAYTIVRFPFSEDGKMFDSAIIQTKVLASWPMNPGYMHSFGMTENFFIIIEQPLKVSIVQIAGTQYNNKKSARGLQWTLDKTIFHVVRRSNGKLFKKFVASTFFYFHIINQYEKDNHIIIDICTYKDGALMDALYADSMKTYQTDPKYSELMRSISVRFVLPLNGDSVTLPDTMATACSKNGLTVVRSEELCSIGCEVPRINYEKYMGKPYKYFYCIVADVDNDNFGGVLKVNVEEKTSKLWYEDRCFLSEPVFVSNPNPKSEDDGVVICSMTWGNERENDVGIVVLDGRSFTELGRTSFCTPSPVPRCFHGWFQSKESSH